MMTSAPPAVIRSAASAIACSPELQKRLIVIAGTVSGRPARSADCRAMLLPDSPSGMAHPRITSSTASFACGMTYRAALG